MMIRIGNLIFNTDAITSVTKGQNSKPGVCYVNLQSESFELTVKEFDILVNYLKPKVIVAPRE